MALTFTALVKLAGFQGHAGTKPKAEEIKPPVDEAPEKPHEVEVARNVKLGGLVYNIQIVLPESRDAAVYDALFRSLKEHLL